MSFPILNGALAQATRRKKFHQRSKEEHQWVSLDFRLHPEIYSKGFRPFHDMGMMQLQIQRLWKLPRLLQLAFGSIHSDVELEVHRLLNRYYDRRANHFDNEESIQKSEKVTDVCVDVRSMGIEITSEVNYMNFLKSQGLRHELIESWVQSNRNGDQRNTRTYVLHETELSKSDCLSFVHDASEEIYVEQSDCVRLVHRPSEVIQENEVKTIKIQIENDYKKKLASIVVTITFHGIVQDSIYVPGRISASLHQLENSTRAVLNVGIADYNLQCLNTVKGMGRLIIEYRPSKSIDNSTFYLSIIGYSKCNYSVDISGAILYYLQDYSMSKAIYFFTLEKEIQALRLQVDDLMLETKLHVLFVSKLNELINDVDQSKVQIHNDMLKCEYDLETDDSDDYFLIENRIKELEVQHSRLHRLKVVRLELLEKHKLQIMDKRFRVREITSAIEAKASESDAIREWIVKSFRAHRGIKSEVQSELEKISRMRNTLVLDKIENAQFICDISTNSSVISGRNILREIDRVSTTGEVQKVNSSFLHQSPQLYSREYLVVELQRLLHEFILNELHHQEVVHPLLDSSLGDFSDEFTFIDTFDSEEKSNQNNDALESHDSDASTRENFCPACCSNPCSRVPFVDIQRMRCHRDAITSSIIGLRRRRVSMMKQNSTESSAKGINDTIVSLQQHADWLDIIMKLENIDKELHDIFQSRKKGFVLIRSLHDYDVLMEVEAAKTALNSEHTRLVATSFAKDFLNQALKTMEDGWVFGEPETNDRLYFSEGIESFHETITQQDQIDDIHLRSRMTFIRNRSQKQNLDLSSFLNSTERRIRIGLIYWLISYFRAMAHIRLQNKSVNPEFHIVCRERKAMMQEHQNALKRDALLKDFYEKARRGFIRIQKRREHLNDTQIQYLYTKEARDILEKSSAIIIQKHYRGHLGKKVFYMWNIERKSIYGWNALCHASSICISRYWRGYIARSTADKLRAQIVDYVINIRRGELAVDEEEYWEKIKFGKYRRQLYDQRKNSL